MWESDVIIFKCLKWRLNFLEIKRWKSKGVFFLPNAVTFFKSGRIESWVQLPIKIKKSRTFSFWSFFCLINCLNKSLTFEHIQWLFVPVLQAPLSLFANASRSHCLHLALTSFTHHLHKPVMGTGENSQRSEVPPGGLWTLATKVNIYMIALYTQISTKVKKNNALGRCMFNIFLVNNLKEIFSINFFFYCDSRDK